MVVVDFTRTGDGHNHRQGATVCTGRVKTPQHPKAVKRSHDRPTGSPQFKADRRRHEVRCQRSIRQQPQHVTSGWRSPKRSRMDRRGSAGRRVGIDREARSI